MASLYDTLKASKSQRFPDYWALLWGRKLSAKLIKTLTGTLPLTFTTSETALRSWTLHGAHMRHTIAYPPIMDYPAQIFAGAAGAVDTWIIYGNSGGVGERTKNLVDITGYDTTHYDVRWYEEGYLKASGTYTDSAPHTWPRFYVELSAGTYTLSGSPDYAQTGVRLLVGTCTDAQGSNFTTLGYDSGSGYTFTLQTDSWVSVRVYTAASLYQQSVDLTLPLMLRPADTTPDFIPYGYQVPITVSQDGQTDKNYDIFIGDAPLTEGQSVSDTQPIEVFEGISTISTTLTNKPRLDLTVFDYYGIASRVNGDYYQVKFKVTHNGSTRTIDIPVPNSMDEGDTVTDIDTIPTEIGENTITLNWDTYPTTTMTIKYKE